ncbi:MAG: Gldg family protein [Planctomycetaceae bacterium]|jgi:ABC-2 type transport system permease protein|nr:Gldg family protein [Planctomycetaceae bacterium]
MLNTRILRAVFKRNFIGYFANPTGYVFICVFVLLGSVAAFLPDEFFNKNLANLDQLILWFPLVMLIFIPAVTMGIWADERRQGTDELLLTIPASDFEIVIGKFFAAIGIFSVSLLFSFVSNLTILYQLGNPDVGLFISAYIGFWLVGLMMLSVGMTASFLTGNLTIAYLLGALFNAPFIAVQWAYILPVSSDWADWFRKLSIEQQFDPFGRGILGFSGVMYFIAITIVMLYFCMVLISRRHWSANQAFHGWTHYLARGVSLLVIAVYLSVIAQRFDVRCDMTQEKLSTLSPATVELLHSLDPNYPVNIEAFISPKVPDNYVKTQLDILTLLSEIEKRGKGKIHLHIQRIEPYTKEAMLADQRFGIVPQTVYHLKQGVPQPENIFLGVTFSSGLNTVKLPFIDRGLSVEYELVRAVCNVTAQSKKRLGILKTDARVMGEFDFHTMQPPKAWDIVDDLSQQYAVSEVDPANPITEKYDAVLAVQPSSLAPNEMINFIDMVRSGQPMLIFEDPLPFLAPQLAGTKDPKLPGNSPMMMYQQQSLPKGTIDPLWEMLGVDFLSDRIPRSGYNPIRRVQKLPPEFLFLAYNRNKPEERKFRPFSAKDQVTNMLRYVLVPFSGSINKAEKPKSPNITVSPLLWTTRANGYVNQSDMFPGGRMGMMPDDSRKVYPDENQYDLAVRIEGELPPVVLPENNEEKADDANPETKPADNKELSPTKIQVILVADTDMITPVFYSIRKQGTDPRLGTNFEFDNVTFVLNAVDSLANDERFISVRGRRPEHRALDKFDEMTRHINESAATQWEDAQTELDETIEAARKDMLASVEKLSDELQKDSQRITQTELISRVEAMNMTEQKKLDARIDELKNRFEEKKMLLEVERQDEVRRQQGKIKALAILVPPTPLLALACVVFFRRRMLETEGASQTRLRKKSKK